MPFPDMTTRPAGSLLETPEASQPASRPIVVISQSGVFSSSSRTRAARSKATGRSRSASSRSCGAPPRTLLWECLDELEVQIRLVAAEAYRGLITVRFPRAHLQAPLR